MAGWQAFTEYALATVSTLQDVTMPAEESAYAYSSDVFLRSREDICQHFANIIGSP